jgi:phage shock protein B
MGGVFVVAIVFGGIILALAIIGSTILMAINIIKGGISHRDQKMQADEARMIQEIYRGLSRMEQRVEALEAIILERHRKDRTP